MVSLRILLYLIDLGLEFGYLMLGVLAKVVCG